MSYALNLLRQVVADKPQDNVFISPISVLAAMSMATAGADTQTEKELRQALGMSEGSYEDAHRAVGQLLRSLQSVKIANRVWVNDRIALMEDYRVLVDEIYNSKVSYLDVSDPQGEAGRVNAWCKRETNERIESLITPDHINPDLAAILTNAVVFKQNWKKQFDSKYTQDDDWTLPNGERVEVPLMNKPFDFQAPVLRRGNVLGLALEFEGDVSMILLQPSVRAETIEEHMSQLDQVLAEVDQPFIDQLLNRYSSDVILAMPRWKSQSEYSMVPYFQGMGVEAAFQDGADFSRMTDEACYISEIIHKTFIEVNEEGAEMVAATAVVMTLECAVVAAPPTIIRLDRPFIYLAVDNKTGTPLFAGRLLDPR